MVVAQFLTQYTSLISNAANLIGVWYGGREIVTGKFSFGFLMAYFKFQSQARCCPPHATSHTTPRMMHLT